MTGRTLIGVAVFAGCVAAAPGPKDPPKKDSPLVGQWQLVWANGEPWPKEFPQTETFGADGTVATRTHPKGGRESAESCRYQTDLSAGPARLDYLFDPPGKQIEGIFKADGDTLTICYATGLGERPKEFAVVGPKTSLFVYKRVKAKE